MFASAETIHLYNSLYVKLCISETERDSLKPESWLHRGSFHFYAYNLRNCKEVANPHFQVHNCMFSAFSTGNGLEIASVPETSRKFLAEGYKTNNIKDVVSFQPLRCGNPCVPLNVLITNSGRLLALETAYSNKLHKFIFYGKQK